MLPMDFAGRYPLSEQYERARHLLDQMGIAEHAHKLPSAVSGGQQQRVAIARALANDPPIVVADEPTGNLDTATARTMLKVFEDLVSQGRTVIIVTHDKEIAQRAHRVVTLEDGRVVNEKCREMGLQRPPAADGHRRGVDLMLGARWYKVLYDLWGNKTRTMLIVTSIAVGLIAWVSS